MANALEIIDDLTAFVDGAQDVFTVTKPPYIAGTVRVFINGLLNLGVCDDGWIELDPVAGTVQLKEVPAIRPGHPIEPKDVVHIQYLTLEPVFVDPKQPIHISKLKQGDVVKVAMKPGYHLNPIANKKADPRWKSPRKGQSVAGYSRTVFFAYVMRNDPVNGELGAVIQARQYRHRDNFEGLLIYKNIQYIYRYVTDVAQVVETAPTTHPGAIALGTLRRTQLGPTLIRVLI